MPPFATKIVWLTLGLVTALASPALAHPFDTYGTGSRLIGMGGAGTASATDVDATYYNPAAAVRADGFVAKVGFLVADDFFEVNGADADLDTIALVEAGFAAALPLPGVMKDRLYLALAVALPHDGLYAVAMPDDETITLPLWDSRNRRIVLEAALAGRVTDWLALGIGASLLPDVYGRVQADLLSGGGTNDARVDVHYDFNVTAGLLVTPVPWLSFGVSYRGAHYTTVDIPVDVDVSDELPPVRVNVNGPDHAVPHEVALGFEAQVPGEVTVSADVTWYDYSAFRYSSPTVTVLDSDDGIVTETKPATAKLRDVFAVRLGAEWRALPWLLVRGGYGYVPSPFGRQEGTTNLLDADRNVVSLGLGFDLPGNWLWEGIGRVAIDLHGQVSILRERAFAKSTLLPDNPGYPSVSLSGGAFSAGLSARFWFGEGQK